MENPSPENKPVVTPIKEAPVLPQISQADILSHSGGSIQEYLSRVLSMNDAGVFHEPTCRFCSSQNRASAEDLYKNQAGSNAAKELAVRNFFLAYEEEISIDAIRNHTKHHLDKGEEELRKIEYIGRISSLNTGRITTPEQVRILLATCLERLTAVGSIKDESQRTKDVALIVTAATKLISLQDGMTVEMAKKGELVKIPRDKFRKAFDKIFADAGTPHEKVLLSSFLNELLKENIQ